MKFGFRQAIAISFLMSVTASTAFAQTNTLTFNDPWIRASVPGQKHGAGYVTITNPSGQATELKAVQSDRAKRVELHTILREDGVAKMRQVQDIPVPANGEVKLEPGGYHIMFVGLNKPFVAGENIPLTLEFTNQSPVIVNFEVKAATHNPVRGQSEHIHHHDKGH
ncbi:copper chaperone PCu(A)C [Orrella sp. 11846]|uniref:copper chaperone PCu(A)C n=1 Tax=Orrella sp. 11846 TaxID=3409913 RepID=UPI003B5A5772